MDEEQRLSPKATEDDGWEYYYEEEDGYAETFDENNQKKKGAKRKKPAPPKSQKGSPIHVVHVTQTNDNEATAEPDTAPAMIATTPPMAGDGQKPTHLMSVPSTSAFDVFTLTKKNDDDDELCPGCPCSYMCILYTALVISVCALLVACIPLVMYLSGDYSTTPSPSSNGARRLLLPSTDARPYKLIHQVNVSATRPNHSYVYKEPEELESECFGEDNCNMTYYVGSQIGWEYKWYKTFNGNYSSPGDRLYPFSTLNVKYGDRLVFRTGSGTKDDVVLVPEAVFNSCNFSLDDYADYYLNEKDDLDKARINGTLLLADWSAVYDNRNDADFLAKYTNWHQDWGFIFDIEDHSDLLPCNDTDLYCQLITADTLYLVSSKNWDRSSRPGNCLGDWRADYSKDDWKGERGLKMKVKIEGYHEGNMQYVEADTDKILDPAFVQDLQYAIGTLGRTLILSQFSFEQRIRSEMHSGLTNVRGKYDGDAAYDDGTYSNGATASIHDHADHIITVGMGEIQAILNGVEFRTRHNDYKLNMPSTTSTDYGKTEPIPYPDVPAEVLNAGSVENQIKEMQEWFRAFKTQNISHRNYPQYFKPILCYLEGTWIMDNDALDEPFDSDRHFVDAKSWKQLHDKIRWMANSGRKNSAENLAHLPSSIRNLVNDTFPIVSNWEYRILCAPLKNDIPLSRLRIKDDLSVQLMGSPKTRDELELTRRARFELNTYIKSSDPDNTDHRWQSGRKRWNYLDYLMEQIPGKDNYAGNVSDALPDGTEEVIHYITDEKINSGYYTRFYGLTGEDAMGTSKHRRSWSDRWLFAAKTTQKKVSSIEFDYEVLNDDGTESYYPAESRWSYAIPIEIIYQTPLTKWNPYGIEYHEKSVYDYRRSGSCAQDNAFDGWAENNAYFTPQGFFNGITSTSSADTAKGVACALDPDGDMHQVMASGHWILFPEIANNVGYVRQRYPIFPIADDGVAAFKEIKAMEDIILTEDYDDQVTGADFFGDGRDLKYGFTVYLQGGGHQHEAYISGSKVRKYWYDYDNDRYHNDVSIVITVDSEERNGHTHTITVGRSRVDDDSEWEYVIGTCRWGSISDDHLYSAGDYMDGQCADAHSSIVRR